MNLGSSAQKKPPNKSLERTRRLNRMPSLQIPNRWMVLYLPPSCRSTLPFDVLIRAMNKLLLLVALTLLLCSSPARADICIGETLKVSHVSGHVVALWRGGEDPIPNASIQLSQLINDESQVKFTTTSDERGYFRIDNVPSGKYEILVTSQHFHAFGTRLHLKASKS